ncbi:MAG: MFS transporter [Blautia sp.]|nr:MFS transporter [Blautia sp.]
MKLFTNSNDVDASLGIVERVAFGLGNFANAFLFIIIMAFLTFYYTDVIGLNAGVIGTIMLVSRVFDGVTDLIMGYIIDHSKSTKFGKARSWLLKSAIPFAISGVLVFMVPQNAPDMLKYIFVFLTYNVCNSVFYTAVAVSYNTLMVRITRNSTERGILGIFLMVMSTLGGLVITSTFLGMIGRFGGTPRAWTYTLAVYAAIGLIVHLICIFGTHERVQDDDANDNVKNANAPGAMESFRYLIKNKYWLMFVGAFSIYWIGYTLMNAGHIYYAQYILGNQGYQPVIANVIQVVTLVAMLLAFFPMKFLGKARSVQVGALIAVIAYVLQIFFAHSYPGILVCSALKGICYGLFCAIIIGMSPDTLDYSHWKFGKDVSGMGVAAVSFGQKIGSGLGGAIFGLVLSAGHYDAAAETMSEEAMRAIQINYTWLPLACAVISLVLMLGYNLDKQLPEIQKQLKEGRFSK